MREITQEDIDLAAKRSLYILDRPKKFTETAAFLAVMGEMLLLAAALFFVCAFKNFLPLFAVLALSAAVWIWIFGHRKKMIGNIGIENARLSGFSEKQFSELAECRKINTVLCQELYSDKVMELFEKKLLGSSGYIRIYCLCNLMSGHIQRLVEDMLEKRAAELEALTPNSNTEERERANGLLYFYYFKKRYSELMEFFENNELIFFQKASSGFDSIYSLMAELAVYHFASGDYEKALLYFKRCLEYEENKLNVREMKKAPANKCEQLDMGAFAVNCARCCVESGDVETAEKFLSKSGPVHRLTPHLEQKFNETKAMLDNIKNRGSNK